MGRWVIKLAGFVFSLVLAGCPCGNGYPYGADGGSCKGGAASRTDPDQTGFGGNGSSSNFWFDPQYSCLPDIGPSKAADRGRLQRNSDGWFLYGDLCDRERLVAPVRLRLDEVRSSQLGLGLRGYQAGIYSPVLEGGYVSAWCVAAEASGSIEVAVFTSSNISDAPQLLVRIESATQASGPAQRTVGTADVRYELTGYRLTVASSFSASDPYQHDGVLTVGSSDTELLCRLTHP